MKQLFLFLVSVLLCLPMTATGADEGLYARKPPVNAAFFRVLNATDATPLEVRLNGKAVTTLAPLTVSRYGFSTASPFHFQLNGKAQSVTAPAKSISTIVWDGRDIFTFKEKPFTNHKKARLKVFNVSTKPITLKTSNGKTTVIKEVAKYQYDYRDVNALELPFTFFRDGTPILTTEKIALHKGRATSLFLIDNGGSSLYIYTEEQM